MSWNISRVDGATTKTTQNFMGGWGGGVCGWGVLTHYIDTPDLRVEWALSIITIHSG